MTAKTSVIITGATPAGLTMAVGLLQKGLQVTVLQTEADDTVPDEICLIYTSTLEALDRIGLANRLIAQGEKIDHKQFWNRDASVLAADLSYDTLAGDTRFPFQLACRRAALMGTLSDAVAELAPNAVVGGLTIDRIEQAGDTVSVRCTGPDGAVTHTADLVVPTHAGASALIGIHVEELLTVHHFLVAECDIDLDDVFPGLNRRALLVGETSLTSITQLGPHRRFVFQFFPKLGREVSPTSDPAEALDGLIGADHPRDILASREVKKRHYLATALLSGRVFLAGKAAHCFDSPINHMGLNTDIQDGLETVLAVAEVPAAGSLAPLERFAQTRHATNLRLLGQISNVYYDVMANSAQDLRFGKFEIRMARLAESESRTRTFLMQRNLMPVTEAKTPQAAVA